jgi:hypothetical protein
LLQFVKEVIVVPFLISWLRLSVRTGSQRAGEDEAGLEGGSLRATRLAPGDDELVTPTELLGLTQATGVVHPGQRAVHVRHRLLL